MPPVEPAPPPPTRSPAPRRALRARRFAPVSAEHSTALRIAMGYFTLTGALTVLAGVGGLVAAAIGDVPVWLVLASGVGTILVGLGALWTGRLLEHRRRLGGIVAIATLLAPVAQWALGRGSASGVLFALAGAVVVASVWNELE